LFFFAEKGNQIPQKFPIHFARIAVKVAELAQVIRAVGEVPECDLNSGELRLLHPRGCRTVVILGLKARNVSLG
jgi:hypothetical protein